MKLLYAFCLIFLLVVLPGCGGVTPLPPPTLTLTPAPTLTPLPSPTYQATKIPDVSSFDIPSWVEDEKLEILLIAHYDRSLWSFAYESVTFLSPATGDRYDITVKPFNSFAWLDADNIVFSKSYHVCNSDIIGVWRVLNVITGDYLQIKRTDPNIIQYCDGQPHYSAYVDWNAYHGEGNPVVLQSNSSYRLLASRQGLYNYDAEVTSNGQLLAILEGRAPVGEGSPSQIAFYDFQSLELLKVITDSKITAMRFASNDSHLVYLKDRLPCIVNLGDFSVICGLEIPENFGRGVYLGGTLKDENKMVLITDLLDNASRVCFEDLQSGISQCDLMNVQSSLCVYDIFAGDVVCPMAAMEDLFWELGWVETGGGGQDLFVQPIRQQHNVIRYLFSPREEFIVFTYGSGHPSGHVFADIRKAVIGVDGQNFYDFGESLTNVAALWRPEKGEFK
jgi:hypothetical protein